MSIAKKCITLLLAVFIIAGLAACGGSGDAEPKAAETASQAAEEELPAAAEISETEAPEPTATPKPTPKPTPVPTATPEPTPEPGPCSDSAAFEGFDTFSYYNSSAESFKDATFGVTTFGELNFTAVDYVTEYVPGTNTRTKVDLIEAGSFGKVVSTWWSKTGGMLCYIVYNPSDAAATIEDCVLVGTTDNEDITFSNGLRYYSQPDEITAILGEPNEIISESPWSFKYCWRDESGDHELTLTVYEPETVGEIDGMSYINLSIADQ